MRKLHFDTMQAVPQLSSKNVLFAAGSIAGSYLPSLSFRHIACACLYSGFAVRSDGHYKIPCIRCRWRCPRDFMPGLELTGALLNAPPSCLAKHWPHLQADLVPLLEDLKKDRLPAGLPAAASLACISRDGQLRKAWEPQTSQDSDQGAPQWSMLK